MHKATVKIRRNLQLLILPLIQNYKEIYSIEFCLNFSILKSLLLYVYLLHVRLSICILAPPGVVGEYSRATKNFTRHLQDFSAH